MSSFWFFFIFFFIFFRVEQTPFGSFKYIYCVTILLHSIWTSYVLTTRWLVPASFAKIVYLFAYDRFGFVLCVLCGEKWVREKLEARVHCTHSRIVYFVGIENFTRKKTAKKTTNISAIKFIDRNLVVVFVILCIVFESDTVISIFILDLNGANNNGTRSEKFEVSFSRRTIEPMKENSYDAL